MSETYEDLLEATIQHLEGLKSRGVRFVPVSTEALENLKRTPLAAKRIATLSPTPIQQPDITAAVAPAVVHAKVVNISKRLPWTK